MQRYYASSTFMLLFLTSACYELPVNNGGESSLRGREARLIEEQKSGENQVVTGKAGAIEGIIASFPPGSISVDTSVVMAEGAPVATSATAAELSLDTTIQSTGTAVTISSSNGQDAASPFSFAIPLPVVSALAEANWDNLVIVYRVKVAAENKTVAGVITRSNITVKDGFATFQTQYFGSYQSAVTSSVISTAVQVESAATVLSREESEKLPAISVSARDPFVMRAGDKVTISGLNFRPTMMLAFGGKKVSNVTIASDASASFIAPPVEGFGLTHLTAEQDGVSQTISIFYAGSSADLPIITEAESEVCAGKQYYDAKGVIRTGTKSCAASSPSIADCASDGETGCVATSAFPAANVNAVNSWDIRAGKSLAGISGSFGLQTNLIRSSLFDRIAGTASISGADLFDTIDDFANNEAMPAEAVTGLKALSGNWSRSYINDSGVGGGVAGNGICDGYEDCVYKDANSGRSWARVDNSQRTFDEAITYCDALSLNGSSDWRVPTQKELMQAYIDGIWSIHAAMNLQSGFNVGSATSYSFDSSQQWTVDMSQGFTDKNAKAGTYYTLCVR